MLNESLQASVRAETSTTMYNIIIISAIVATAYAAPGYLLEEHPVYHAVPLSGKSTFTQSSQVVDYGSTYVHAPALHTLVHSPVKTTITKSNQLVNHGGTEVFHPIHAYDSLPNHVVQHIPSKSTITKTKQVVNHGGTAIVHAPIVHAPIVHTPIVHAPIVYHSSPVVSLKTGDSAITHQSSAVHETVPVVNSVNLLSYHH